MNTFADMVAHSLLARALAIIILFLVVIAAILVATVDFLENRAVPEIVTTVIGFGIGTAGTLTGINFGVILQPMKKEDTAHGTIQP